MRKRKQQMERALAHIQKVEWVKPIEGADNIELIGVLGWICVEKKVSFMREIGQFILKSIADVPKMMNVLLSCIKKL